MGKAKRSVLTLLALLVLLSLAVGATAAAAQTVNTDNFRGKITAVNVATGDVTVANNRASMTFGTDANTEIHRNNQNATVADLRVGDSAKVEFFVDTLIAKGIDATGGK